MANTIFHILSLILYSPTASPCYRGICLIKRKNDIPSSFSNPPAHHLSSASAPTLTSFSSLTSNEVQLLVPSQRYNLPSRSGPLSPSSVYCTRHPSYPSHYHLFVLWLFPNHSKHYQEWSLSQRNPQSIHPMWSLGHLSLQSFPNSLLT